MAEEFRGSSGASPRKREAVIINGNNSSYTLVASLPASHCTAYSRNGFQINVCAAITA